jgi:outer membrane biosynthesis protein TonB
MVEAAPVPEPTPEQEPLAPAAKPVAKPEPKPAPRPAPPPRPVAKPAPKPAPVPAPAGPAVARVEKLPALVVTRTEWHPDPARRRALIRVEGRAEPLELRHGDAVGALVVTSIEPSGVVFRMGEVEVRRKIGETEPRN